MDFNTFDSDIGLDLEGSNLESIHGKIIHERRAQGSQKLYQLAEVIGVSRTLPGTLGLVVAAAPGDASVRKSTGYTDSGG